MTGLPTANTRHCVSSIRSLLLAIFRHSSETLIVECFVGAKGMLSKSDRLPAGQTAPSEHRVLLDKPFLVMPFSKEMTETPLNDINRKEDLPSYPNKAPATAETMEEKMTKDVALAWMGPSGSSVCLLGLNLRLGRFI